MTNKTSLSDTPLVNTINDFGTERYVNGLIRFIERSATPMTIALQGEWGSGKTSLMNKLHDNLCADGKPFIGISVNTWEYSMLSTPEIAVVRILEYIIKELSADDPEPCSKFKRFMSTAGNIAFRAGREALKVATGPAGSIFTEAFVGNEIGSDHSKEENISLSELRTSLNRTISSSLNSNKRGVIVFVDDLDRLNPPLAVEILELLKNIFTLDNCIFVLAIDYDVVVKGLRPKFGELTEKNEREFRSFFDKIIQVPFSLPVNNYRPMDFVLKSLVEVGYIKEFESASPFIREMFTKIVEFSVGKNPRSIKRLINTLSLIDCITQCGDDISGRSNEISMDDKLLNFIVVAIQICYPRIYRMLAQKPGFTSWDSGFMARMGITCIQTNDEEEIQPGNQWIEVLESACENDPFLNKHINDINQLFSMIIEILGKTNQTTPESLSKKMKQILDKSSVTGVDSEMKSEDLDKSDKKSLMEKLHQNIISYVIEKRPDISKYKLKKNTGNGGIYIWYGRKNTDRFDVTFSPSLDSGKIALQITLDMQIQRPERLKGKSFDEIMEDQTFNTAISRVDSVMSPLLNKNTWFFHGKIYDETNSYYPSYEEELRYIHRMGWTTDDNVTNNPQYRIILDKPSYFEDRSIISSIGDTLIANYDFRCILKDWI